MKKFYAFLVLLLVPFFCVSCSSGDLVADASTHASTYNIVGMLDFPNKTLSATENLNYRNNSEYDLEFLLFHLHPNAFREDAENPAVSPAQETRAYPNGFSAGGIEIVTVKVSGTQADFNLEGADDGLLRVQLGSVLHPKSQVEVTISFVLTIPNVNHRFGYGEHTLNLGNWYPVVCVLEEGEFDTDGYTVSGDPFYTDIANFEVTLTYPSSLILASTGEVQKNFLQGSTKSSTYRALAVRDFAMVLSADFEVKSAQTRGIDINYFYFDDSDAECHLQAAVDAVDTFCELIGEYPYKVLNVVKACFLHGGMEYPNLVYISDQVTQDAEYINVIVHEIAHQWWYGVVGNDQLAYGWIDEGLAEYSTALFYDLNPGYAYTSTEVIANALSSYLLFCDVYREVYDRLDTSMNRSVSDFNSETEYVYLTYVKGLLMFDSVSEVIGQNRMNKCLKELYRQYAMQFVTPVELIDCFSKASGRDLKKFMTSWLDGTVILEQLASG